MNKLSKYLKIIFVLCFAFSMTLGAFSIRPFTKLWLPWMMVSQWKKKVLPPSDDLSCKDNLKSLGVAFENGVVLERYIGYGCIIDTPVTVSTMDINLNNIAYQGEFNYVTLSCEFALRLQSFIHNVLLPEAIKTFSSKPVAFLHKGSYSCRDQREFTTIKSEHAFAQALDFAGLKFEDGSEILIEKNYYDDNAGGKFLRWVAEQSCKEFGTTLGPAFNELHKDHLHWSIGFPKVCIY